ncbi:MAG: DUF192 domain-containing protein [Patescibacteria group bacterium]
MTTSSHTSLGLNVRHWIIFAGFVIALIVLWILVFPHAAASADLHVGKAVLHVELATTEAQRELGLGNRTSLPADHGMLFVFPVEGIYPFWMKGMEFPLDIVWIDKGTVTEVETLRQPTSTTAIPEEYQPKYPADRVLEINAGEANKLGIGTGTALQLPR